MSKYKHPCICWCPSHTTTTFWSESKSYSYMLQSNITHTWYEKMGRNYMLKLILNILSFVCLDKSTTMLLIKTGESKKEESGSKQDLYWWWICHVNNGSRMRNVHLCCWHGREAMSFHCISSLEPKSKSFRWWRSRARSLHPPNLTDPKGKLFLSQEPS